MLFVGLKAGNYTTLLIYFVIIAVEKYLKYITVRLYIIIT